MICYDQRIGSVVSNRIPGVKCEIGTCLWDAAFTEHVIVIPGNPDMKHERHYIDIVFCRCHDEEFELNGLAGRITAYGDEIVN